MIPLKNHQAREPQLEIIDKIDNILETIGVLMKGRSLRTKFMLLFFIFFFVPYGSLTLFSVSTSKEMMKRGTIEHLQNLVEVKETAIEQWIRERLSDGRSIAASQEAKSLDPKRIEPFLSLIKHFERAYLEIWVLNLKGQVVSGNGSNAFYKRRRNGSKRLLKREPSSCPLGLNANPSDRPSSCHSASRMPRAVLSESSKSW